MSHVALATPEELASSPTLAALHAASLAKRVAYADWAGDEDGASPEGTAYHFAARAKSAAKKAYACAYDDARVWVMSDDQGCSENTKACGLDEALERAEEWAQEGEYEPGHVVIVDVTVRPLYSRRHQVQSVEVDCSVEEAAPECEDGHEHDWCQSSVEGSGGGVIVHETCAHCGADRRTDTWASDHRGRQGYTAVTYLERGLEAL